MVKFLPWQLYSRRRTTLRTEQEAGCVTGSGAEVLREKKISFPCQYSNTVPTCPYPRHCTDYGTSAPIIRHHIIRILRAPLQNPKIPAVHYNDPMFRLSCHIIIFSGEAASVRSWRAATNVLSRHIQPTKHDPSVSELVERPLR